MKERPILFSGPMVRALLAGNKTQTRRTVKPQREILWFENPRGLNVTGSGWFEQNHAESDRHSECWQGVNCPFGVVGDRLWVRETWCPLNLDYCPAPRTAKLPKCGQSVIPSYRADHIDPRGDKEPMEWRPSIFMPRWASRLTLEITDIRVERLQSISEEDAMAEGVEKNVLPGYEHEWKETDGWRDYLLPKFADCWPEENARDSFASLWRSINGADSYETNPFCWVLTFKKVDV
ncbi:hypothetical protein IAD21_00946 [Abditibacteriota bacterium]|nr:hypothetical protein IAD21_00946 [Abditibacteriota bacterium]